MRQSFLAALGGLVLLGVGASADASGDEQAQVANFIRKLYSYSSSTFELSEFGGKYQPKKGCQLAKEFFSSVFIRSGKQGACEIVPVGAGGSVRFPALSTEELSPETWTEPPPKPEIKEIHVDGEQAVVKVNFVKAAGRVVYFLVKGDRGWRVANALVYERWPLSVPPEGCRQVLGFSFALPPRSERELEDLPAACRSIEKESMGELTGQAARILQVHRGRQAAGPAAARRNRRSPRPEA